VWFRLARPSGESHNALACSSQNKSEMLDVSLASRLVGILHQRLVSGTRSGPPRRKTGRITVQRYIAVGIKHTVESRSADPQADRRPRLIAGACLKHALNVAPEHAVKAEVLGDGRIAGRRGKRFQR
jgi:hypothetical protein